MKYRHYRNKQLYEILGTALDKITQQSVIIYYNSRGEMFTCPVADFYGLGDSGEQRFTLVEEDHADAKIDVVKQLMLQVFADYATAKGFTDKLSDIQYKSVEKILTLMGLDLRIQVLIKDITETCESSDKLVVEQVLKKYEKDMNTPIENQDFEKVKK